MAAPKLLRITYIKSMIGYPKDQRATLYALGLRRLHQSVLRPDTPAVRGMIAKVQHLVRVEPVEDDRTASGVLSADRQEVAS
ncbi:50S ribosomal protein L30 [Thermorudis peleae]|uniref:50S ribosomal protein L30 n=1 Tax=Thermorudis peleae TaxID=1382356 RepID=UPI0005720946|nr:50S ribosomal protein L30 [Thermorudis peleae]MBX6754007.1 50S ribosomal protein L30 [Thermorudis peleae]